MDSVPFLQVETDAVNVTETNFWLQRVNDFAFILPIKKRFYRSVHPLFDKF